MVVFGMGIETVSWPGFRSLMWISGRKKIRRNFQRDSEVSKQLNSLGWRVLVIWECELNDISKLESIDRAIRKVIA